MTLRPRSIFGIAAMAVGMAWATGAAGQSAAVELRYATSAPPKTVWEMQVQRFQKQVEEGSKGTLKINAFLNSQLGSEQDTVAQVARGRIDMGGYSITAGSLLVSEISLLNIPFLFKDQKEQDCVYDNHLTKLTQDMFVKKGVVMIGWSEVGVADIIGKKAYVSPSDLKGLKARSAPNKVAAFMWSQFGANPIRCPLRSGTRPSRPGSSTWPTRRRRSTSSRASPSSPRS
jgi:TRAP-type C4-dicarboxylate transport system substrate-binding protein